MSHCHWSSSSPLSRAACAGAKGWEHPANPVCPAHTQWAACPAHRKTAPAEKHKSEPWSEQPMEVRTRRVLGACCGGIKTERQNLGSDPFQGRCFSCEGQAAAPTGAGSTRCTGSSHCRPLLSHSKCNTWSCAQLALPTPATPNSPCGGRRLQTASPYLSKITGSSHRRVNASHSKKKILSLELKK